MTTTMKFDNAYVFDRLPISHEQKIALIKKLSMIEKIETPDQCCTENQDNDQTDVVSKPPSPLPLHRSTSVSDLNQIHHQG